MFPLLDEARLDLSKARLALAKEGSDNDDFYLISKEEVAEQLHLAEEFVDAVEAYLASQYK